MNSKGKVVTIFVLLLFNASQIWANCNVCLDAVAMACVSQTQYQACVNGLPAGAVNTCPAGYICSTSTPAICQPSTGTIVATCSNCNVCNTAGTFACTGVNTYALCLGTTIPSVAGGSCGANLVCNWELPEICGDPTMGTAPTCPSAGTSVVTTTTSTPTISPTSTLPTYAQFLCQQIRQNGRFALPSTIDNTCRRYIYCFLTTTSIWSGQIYTCAGSTYFDASSKYCVATRPIGCAA